MKKITLLSPLLKTPKEIDNYVSQNFGSNDTASPEYIKASWFAIANLYFTAHDYNKAEKFLLQLLYYQPNDIKANELLAIVYRKHDNLESALEYYERTHQITKKYDPRAIQLLRDTYTIIIRYAELQNDKRSCLKIRDKSQKAFRHIIQRRYNFMYSLEWNLHLKKTYEKLLDEYIDQVEKWEETSLLNPQTLGQWSKYRKEYKSRILRHDGDGSKSLSLSLLDKNQILLNNAYEDFKSCLSYKIDKFPDPSSSAYPPTTINHFVYLMCQRLNLTESYGKDLIKKEELDLLKWMSKYSHQFDMIAICCAPYDLKRFLMGSAWHFESGTLLNKWLKYLFPNLQNRPPNNNYINELLSLNTKNEQDIDNIEELKSQKQQKDLDDLTNLFLNLIITNTPKHKQYEDNQKKIIMPTLMDIELFLLILLIQQQYHCVYNEKGGDGANNLGEVLYLVSHSGGSGGNSKKNKNSGWCPTENHYKFWRTLLSLHGRDDPDKRVYTNDLMSNDDFKKCLGEIRGIIDFKEYDYNGQQLKNILNIQKDLFQLMANIFEKLYENKIVKSDFEVKHCTAIRNNGEEDFYHVNNDDVSSNNDKQKEKFNISSNKFSKNIKKRFLILDDTINKPGYKIYL
ncbi:2398_t:CDS:10 [Entrophospora sp. SA101]|nr:2398_t:CDS:10 [Entrophospora sp. SA101]